MKQPVTAIFDIGKTNKKLLIFDEELSEIEHEYIRFEEIPDDEGFLSENLPELTQWMQERIKSLIQHPTFDLKALNFSTYGASLVHLNQDNKICTPFYNYLKPFPEELKDAFLVDYGPENEFATATSSPFMGMLNSGLQLYYLKKQRPALFNKIESSLHFPQYLSWLFSKRKVSDFTSLGCHTALWDSSQQSYHQWVKKESLESLLPDVVPSATFYPTEVYGKRINVGVGVHDSSSALIPYINTLDEPFILLSTGTWSISMNFFNDQPLTEQELTQDCLNFLGIKGTSVKASRLFLGKHLSNQARLISDFFQEDYQRYKSLSWKPFNSIRKLNQELLFDHSILKPERFGFKNGSDENIKRFENYQEALFHLMDELTDLQIASLHLTIGKSEIRNLYIDGGFSSNRLFVKLLSDKLPEFRIFTTSFALGTALGAAMLVNYRRLSKDFLEKNYQVKSEISTNTRN